MLVVVPQQLLALRRVSIQPGTRDQEPKRRTPLSMSCSPFSEPFCTIHGSVSLAAFATGSCDRSCAPWSAAHSTPRKVRAHILTSTGTGASMSSPGNTPLSFPPANRAILDAGNVCRRSGLDAMTPESIASVSFSGGGVVRPERQCDSPALQYYPPTVRVSALCLAAAQAQVGDAPSNGP